jgi:hypothetical protein
MFALRLSMPNPTGLKPRPKCVIFFILLLAVHEREMEKKYLEASPSANVGIFLCSWYLQMVSSIKTPKEGQIIFPQGQKQSIGKVLFWKEHVLDPLFLEEEFCENGCRKFSWLRGEWHFPLIAHKHKVTIIVDASSNMNMRKGETSPRLEKWTNVCSPQKENNNGSLS